MIKSITIGYPRIGPKRELKKALEKFWKSEIKEDELQKVAKELREYNWKTQKENGIDLISSNDFSFYDQVLDMACLLGVVPDRYKWDGKNVNLETYFAMARGSQTSNLDASALEMTKWFDTNYHYLVPELKKNQVFKISSTKPFDEFNEAKQKGYNTKPILIGPLTFLFLSKTEDGSKTINLLDKILPIYKEIIKKLSSEGAEWIQIDEPYLVKDLDNEVISKIKSTLNELKSASGNSKLLVTSYFESLDIPILGKIKKPGNLEGGDVVWISERSVAVGEGYRSNSEGIKQLKDLLSDLVDNVISVPLPHWTGPLDCLHLMSLLSPIDKDLFLVYSRLLPVPFLKYLSLLKIKLIHVPDNEYDSMGCNVLAVAPKKVIMLEGNPETKKMLEKNKVEVFCYDGSEISLKGAGGPTCLTRPFLRQ